MTETQTPDAIRQRMRQLRSELRDDVADVVESARRVADWQAWVQKYPWLSLGLATAVGYMVVPRRIQVVHPDPQTLLELARKHQLVVDANPKPRQRAGVGGLMLDWLARSAVRGAVAFISDQAAKGLRDATASRDAVTQR